MSSDDSLRSSIYTLLTVLTVAAVAARIGNTELVFEPSMYRAAGDAAPDAPPRDWPKTRPAPMPTFSSNDRSRWATVRALVDHGTWAIGQRRVHADGTFVDEGIVFENGWQTVDKVLKPEPDGAQPPYARHYYSSKPPLLSAVAAGEYWLLKRTFGWEITRETNLVVRTILWTLNAAPLAAYLVMLRRLIERFGATDWGRLFVFATACFGTFLTTFSNTLNNHTLGAVVTLAAVYPVLSVPDGQRLSPSAILQSGFFAGLAVCLEFPAATLAGLLFLVLLYREPVRTLLLGLPAALAPIAAQFLLNHVAVGVWEPVYSKFGGPWYEYPDSHWLKPPASQVKPGIDFARTRESILVYWFHLLVGHHGLFSLTPVWLLSFAGMIGELRRRERPRRFLAPLVLLTSLIVIGFYMVTSNNYGGWTSGLRWLIWLAPLWLLMMLPVVDRLGASRWGRRFAYALLAVSVFSASYPAWNPWRHPWLYHFLDARGWVPY